jgi:hypothetical protein
MICYLRTAKAFIFAKLYRLMKLNKTLIGAIASVFLGIGALNSDAQLPNSQNYNIRKYSAEFAKMGFDSSTVYKYLKLKIRPEEVSNFRDTEKPNALFVFPWSDCDGFFTEGAIYNLFQDIRNEYDTKVVIASKEDDIYSAIKSTHNIELLALSGHAGEGGRHLCFGVSGRDAEVCSEEYREGVILDPGDKELEEYLDLLHPNATILVYSCYAANQRGNIADFISLMSKQKNVIAPRNNLHGCSMKINSMYPLDLQFISDGTGKDCTFALKCKNSNY